MNKSKIDIEQQLEALLQSSLDKVEVREGFSAQVMTLVEQSDEFEMSDFYGKVFSRVAIGGVAALLTIASIYHVRQGQYQELSDLFYGTSSWTAYLMY